MRALAPGWQKRVRREAAASLAALPMSARPQRERPAYVPPPVTAVPAEPVLPAALVALDPIVGAYAQSGSPCGDPMGIEWWAKTIRVSDLEPDPARWSPAVRREVARLTDELTRAAHEAGCEVYALPEACWQTHPGGDHDVPPEAVGPFGGAPAGSMPPCP